MSRATMRSMKSVVPHQHIGVEHFREAADRRGEFVEISATVRVEPQLRRYAR